MSREIRLCLVRLEESMPTSRIPRRHQPADERLIAQVRPGMHVEDATGEAIGVVIYVRLSTATDRDEATLEPARSRAATLSGLLLRNDYFKFDAQRRRQWEEHYYAMADDVAVVDADTVRLSKPLGELMTPNT